MRAEGWSIGTFQEAADDVNILLIWKARLVGNHQNKTRLTTTQDFIYKLSLSLSDPLVDNLTNSKSHTRSDPPNIYTYFFLKKVVVGKDTEGNSRCSGP